MTVSNNGFDCEDMYGKPCEPELEAVRMGTACYQCRVCGSLVSSSWPSAYSDQEDSVWT